MFHETVVNPVIKKIENKYMKLCNGIKNIGVISKRDQRFMKQTLDVEKGIALQKLGELTHFGSFNELKKFDSARITNSHYKDGKKLLEEYYAKGWEEFQKLVNIDDLCKKLTEEHNK